MRYQNWWQLDEEKRFDKAFETKRLLSHPIYGSIKMAIEKNYTTEELRREAILVLHKNLGALNTYRFMAMINQSQDDYIKLQQRLFKGQSVDEIYEAAKLHWEARKPRE